MSYDNWKSINPADAELGPEPQPEQKIVTSYWAKPLPWRDFDWQAYFEGDEPDTAGRYAVGYGKTEAEAVADLIDNYPRESS